MSDSMRKWNGVDSAKWRK